MKWPDIQVLPKSPFEGCNCYDQEETPFQSLSLLKPLTLVLPTLLFKTPMMFKHP